MPPLHRQENPNGGRYAVFLLDVRGCVAACHIDGMRFSSFGGDDLPGRPFLSLHSSEPSSRLALERALGDAAQGKRSVLTDVEMLRRGGRRFRATVSVDALRSTRGKVHGLVAVVHDRSDSRVAAERLRESERRFRLFANAVADHAICMLDADGVVLDWNLGAQRMTLFRHEQIEGQRFDAFFPAHERARLVPRQLLERAMQAGRIEHETDLLRGDGEPYPACLTLDAVQDNHGDVLGFACIIRDETRRVACRRPGDAQAVARSRTVMAHGQLDDRTAHDFNNALQGIISSLDIASIYLEQHTYEKATHYLAVALDSAKRAGGLTQRLSVASSRDETTRRTTTVETLLTTLRDALLGELGDHILLRLEIEPGLPAIACESDELEAAVRGLAINARDTMQGHGTLVLRGCRASARQTDDGDHFMPPVAQVEISVTDDGPGMDDDALRRACEPASTEDEQEPGPAPALARVSDFMARHGGHTEMASAPGSGTRVSLYFPVDDDAPRAEETPAQELDGLIVLIVENDGAVRESIATRLAQLGCQVFKAATGRDALLALAARPALDLLLSDIDLPALDDYELCREARARFPALRVILMTGMTDNDLPARNDLDRATDVLLKPFDMGELLTRIRMLLPAP